jgi:hypothetical protein
MERIDPIRLWQTEPGRIERIPPPDRASRDERRDQRRREEAPARPSREDADEGDDGHEHIDVTA